MKAWCSEETIRHMGFYTDELEKCKNEDYVLCTQKIEIEREKYWMKKRISLLIKGLIVL